MTASVAAIRSRATPPDGRRRGAALPIVLLFAALLAGLAASALRSSLSGVRAASAFAEATRADELGRGAADALAYHLATQDAAARRGGRLKLRLAEGQIDLDYRSESARIDANLAPLALVAALLVAAGAEPAEAAAAAERARLFRERAARKPASQTPADAPEPLALTPAGGLPAAPGTPGLPEAAASAPAGAGSEPKPLAIRDPAEVARAWGLSDGLAERILPSLTVSNGTPKVDPILAGRLVLQALLGSDERVDDYVARRANGFTTEDAATELLPVPARAFAGFHDSGAVCAVARVTLSHGFVRRYEMVLAPSRRSGNTTPDIAASSVPAVVSWRRLP